MRRFARSAERVALPVRSVLFSKRERDLIQLFIIKPFNPDAVLDLIKLLVDIEAAWIPNAPGYSLYIRPTIIGTKAGKHSRRFLVFIVF